MRGWISQFFDILKNNLQTWPLVIYLNYLLNTNFQSCSELKPRFIFTEIFQSFFQNNLNNFGHFYDCKWHYDQIDLSFFGHFKTTSVYDRKIPKKQVETQSREMILNLPTTSSALHGCCSVGSNCLILHSVKTMFFNELIQCNEDGLSSWANSNVKTA